MGMSSLLNIVVGGFTPKIVLQETCKVGIMRLKYSIIKMLVHITPTPNEFIKIEFMINSLRIGVNKLFYNREHLTINLFRYECTPSCCVKPQFEPSPPEP